MYDFTKHDTLLSSNFTCRPITMHRPYVLVRFLQTFAHILIQVHTRSANQGLLRVPFARTSTRQNRAFAVVGPQFGITSLCRSAHSYRTLSQTLLSQLKGFYFFVLGLGAPLSSPT